MCQEVPESNLTVAVSWPDGFRQATVSQPQPQPQPQPPPPTAQPPTATWAYLSPLKCALVQLVFRQCPPVFQEVSKEAFLARVCARETEALFVQKMVERVGL